MSKMKTRNHPFFYGGMYWSSRKQYAAWVKAQRIMVICQNKGIEEPQ